MLYGLAIAFLIAAVVIAIFLVRDPSFTCPTPPHCDLPTEGKTNARALVLMLGITASIILGVLGRIVQVSNRE